MLRVLLALALLALALPSSASGAGVPDPGAPPDSPPHWLPGEAWVSNHWLPYDEGRLYRLLAIKRSDIWLQLRDEAKATAGRAGTDFDLKEFHRAALDVGSVPLDVLRHAVVG